MYSASTWGGSVDPHILVKFKKETVEDDSDPIASMVIFEWRDYDYIGVLPTPDSTQVPNDDRDVQEHTDHCHRKNSSATQKRSISTIALSTKQENLSWRQMQQICPRACFLLRQYISKIQVFPLIMELRIRVITVSEVRHILHQMSNIQQRLNFEMLMESYQPPKSPSFRFMEESRLSML